MRWDKCPGESKTKKHMKPIITPKTVDSLRDIAAMLTLLLTLGGLAAPRVEAAQPERTGTFPYQAFVDKFVSPNSPLSYVPVNPFAVVSHEKGSLIITSTALPRWSALAMVCKDGEPIVAQATSMRVVARLANEASALGLWTRDGVYVCNLVPKVTEGPDGEPVITSVLRLSTFFGFVVVEEMEVDLNAVDNDVVVEFDTVDSTITMRAWAVNNPSLVYETVGWTNPNPDVRPSGALGLAALGGVGNLPLETPRGVEYYQFKLKIIPPTSNRR